MAFTETINSVIEFYEDFNKVFTEIDADYTKIDDNGGINDKLLHEIVKSLNEYADTLYKKIQHEDKDKGTEDIRFYKELDENLTNIKSADPIDVIELFKYVNKLRDQVHDYMIKDSDWPGQRQCLNVLKSILSVLTDNSRIENPELDIIKCYAIVHILRELVADCAISIFGLKPLSEWGYETSAYSRLEAEEQFVVLLNQAILTDRMYFCFQSLKIILSRLNKLIRQFLKLSWEVYYVVGFLNFKVHKYEDAKYCFENVIKQKNVVDNQVAVLAVLDKDRASLCKKRFFHSVLLRAYCNEYSGDFEKAIEIISISVKDIEDILHSHELDSIEQKYEDIMTQICDKASKNELSLLKLYMPSYKSFRNYVESSRERTDDEQLMLDMMYETLHILAHCLNEYGIDQKNKNEIGCLSQDSTGTQEELDTGKFIQLARCMMRSISESKCDYWLCYATIHGEYQDYYKATEELDKAKTKYKDKHKGIEKESYSAEISFFKYYFTLLYNRPSLSDKEKFEVYYQKYDDDDAKCHLKIFQFRYELRKYINDLAQLIKDSDRAELTEIGEREYVTSFFSKDTLKEIPEPLINLYNEICNLEPTLYMNVKVRIELRALQRAYMCVKLLREYLLVPSEENLLRLNNASSRFIMLQKESLPRTEQPFFSDEVSTENVSRSFKDVQYGIFDSLFKNKNLFLLAPVSGSVVFTYQTGDIKCLYNTNSILPEIKKGTDIDSITSLPWDIVEPYDEYFRKSQPRVLSNIDWEKLKQYTDKIYYWQNDLPNQLLIYNYDNQNCKGVCVSRPLLEGKKFENKLLEISNEITKRGKNYKKCAKDSRQSCRLIKKTGINMECIDEETLIFVWNRINEIYEEWIIVPCSGERIKRQNYHDLHLLIWNVHSKFEEFIREESEDPTEDSVDEMEIINEQLEEGAKDINDLADEGIAELRKLLFEIEQPLREALDHYRPLAKSLKDNKDFYADDVTEQFNKLDGYSATLINVKDYITSKQYSPEQTKQYKDELSGMQKGIDSIGSHN